jgi:osmotically-inducible protein OsmY
MFLSDMRFSRYKIQRRYGHQSCDPMYSIYLSLIMEGAKMATATLERPVIECPEDELLARNVRNFVLGRIQPATNHVHVKADGGTVTLTGRVSSFYQKQLWLHGAQRVAGVRRIIDEIEVGAIGSLAAS